MWLIHMWLIHMWLIHMYMYIVTHSYDTYEWVTTCIRSWRACRISSHVTNIRDESCHVYVFRLDVCEVVTHSYIWVRDERVLLSLPLKWHTHTGVRGVCICVCACVLPQRHTHTRVHSICMCVCVCACMRACVSVCVCVWERVGGICVRMITYTCMCIYAIYNCIYGRLLQGSEDP